jgi:hypothetical protein
MESLESRVLLTSYVVTTLSDAIAPDGQVSLREAITAAVSGVASGDALAGGASNSIAFLPSLTATPQTLDLALALPDLTGVLTLTGPGSDRLTINRNSGSAFRLFNVTAGATVTIEGLKLTNGSSAAGGAILNQGSLSLNNVWLAGNVTSGSGTVSGGGALSNIAGVVSINASTISSNSASGTGTGGGGIDNVNGTMTITSTTLYNNVSLGNFGGALRMQGNSSLTITSSTIYNNSAGSSRGGIYVAAGKLTMGNTIVAGNLPLSQADIFWLSGTLTSNGFNYVGAMGTGSNSNFANGVNHDQLGTTAARLAPMLGALQVNAPGRVPTLLPQNGTSGTLLDSGSALGLFTDANGQARTFDDAAANASGSDGTDIGAVEVGPHASISGNAAAVINGSATPSTANGTDFGAIVQNGGTLSQTFTVFNTGQRTLTLGAVSVPAGYSSNRNSSWSIAPGASDTFTVTFSDSGIGGQHPGTVSVATNDGLANPFAFQINTLVQGPKLTILSSGAATSDAIANADYTPSWSDGTYFGTVRPNAAPASRTFTLKNDGTASLNILGVDLLSHPALALAAPVEPTLLNPGQSMQFTVTMSALAGDGEVNGFIDIFSDDPNESFVEFQISGRTGEPLEVRGNGNLIPDNATVPSDTTGTTFGNPPANSTGPTRTYTVLNDGQTPLAISNLFVPAGYSLVKGLAATIAPGTSDTLILQLNTTSGGTWNGRVSFETGDSGLPQFDFAITGSVPQFLELFQNKYPALSNFDGSVVIALDSNLYWKSSGGFQTLPPLLIGGVPAAYVKLKSVSPDGTVFGGQVGLDNGNPFGSYQAFIWSQATGFKLLDGPGNNAQVMSLSANGLHASGIAYVSGVPTSVVWNAPLTSPVAQYLSTGGTGGYLSSDGSLGVFGSFRWSAANGLVALAPATNTSNPVGTAISSDGYVVGHGNFNGTPVATMWDLLGNPTALSPGFGGVPQAVSAGGQVVTGHTFNGGQQGFVWIAGTGPQSIDSYFASLGISTANYGLTLTNLFVSGDGKTIAGNIRNNITGFTNGYVLASRGYSANTPPDLTVPTGLTVLEGQTIAIGAQGTSASEAAGFLSYSWDLDNDGIFGETGPAATRGAETGAGITLSSAGVFGPSTLTISARVTDAFGLSTTLTRQVRVTAPAMLVQGQGQAIADGDALPRLLDGTIFNAAVQGSALSTRSFVVQNNGDGLLSISAVTLPAGFVVVQPLPATIASGSQATLIVGLSTAAAGTYGGSLIIESSDHAHGSYDFAITGSVLATSGPPIATVLDSVSLLPVLDNATAPSAINGTDFGHVARGADAPIRTFVVQNQGAQPLTISNLFIPAGYSLIKGVAATIAPGQSDTLVLQMNTAVGGIPDGRVSFRTNDPAAPLFDFAVTGSISQFLNLFQSKWPALSNNDGSVIIAVDSNTYWTPLGGIQTLPPLLVGGVPATFVKLKAVSPDGSVFGGQVALDNGNQFGAYQAFVWSQAAGFKLLDGPGNNAQVMSLSANGLHASGIAYVAGLPTTVMWDNPLTAPAATYLSTGGTGGYLSADGSLGVFGGYRWSLANGLAALAPAPNTNNPVGTAISPDGYIVGHGGFVANGTPVATMWDLQGNPVQLSPGFAGVPQSVSAGGQVVTGHTFNASQQSFVWKSGVGPQSIESYFASQGISTANLNLALTNLLVSGDGATITGNLHNTSTGTTDGYILSQRGYSKNTAPIPFAGGLYSVLQGESVSLGASATDANETSQTLSFQWDLDNDGIFGESGAAALRGNENGSAPVFSAAGLIGPATYIVGLKVTDSYGLTTPAQAAIQITQPTISILAAGSENAGALSRGALPPVIPYSVGGATGSTGTSKWTQPGGLGTPVYISYSFSNLLDGTLPGSLSSNQLRAAAEKAMALWAAAAPLIFVEAPDSGPDPRVIGNGDYPAASHPMIRIGQRNIITDLALTNVPNSAASGQGGDINFNSTIANWALSPEQGNDIRQVMIHELGLALGLNVVPGQSPSIMAGYDGRFTNGTVPQLDALDLQAIQAVYGTGSGGVYSLFPPAIPLNISDAPLLAGLPLTGVRIFNVPSDAMLSAGVHEGNGTWLVAPHQLKGLMIRPPANFQGTFTLSMTAYVADATTRQGNITVDVAAVAYPPVITVNGTAQGDAGTPIHLPVSIAFAVPPGSGSLLTLAVTGVPASAAVAGGTSLGNGAWSVDPAHLDQFTITPALGSENFTLQLTATNLETSNAQSASSALTFPVTVIPVLPDAFESSDNLITQPTYLPRDVIQSHSIAAAGDVDWYTFNIVRQNSEINLRVRSPNDASTPLIANLALTLYSDAAGTLILNQTIGDLAMTGMLAGQYYLKVEHANAASVANYTIQLGISDPSALAPVLVGTASLTGAGRDFYDKTASYPLDPPNPSSPIASTVADNQKSAGVPVLLAGNQVDAPNGVTRAIYATGDVDWAQFTLASRSVVTLLAYDPGVTVSPSAALVGNHPAVPAIICVFNSSDSQMTSIYDPNSAFPTVESKFAATLEPGTYYVLVYRYNNGGTIPRYDLNLNITAAPDTSRPAATINLAAGQASPTSNSAVNFTAQFTKPVTGLTGAGLILPAGVSASITPNNATNGFASSYTILATGIAASASVSIGIADGAARDASGNTSLGVAPGQPTVAVDKTPPAVTGLYVRGTTWTPSFLASLASSGQGDAMLGYRISVGSGAQLQSLTWNTIDQISIVLSEGVTIGKSNLTLTGQNLANYNIAGSSFAYNSSTYAATWTLPSAITPDRLALTLHADGASPVRDSAGNLLDGEWANPASAASATGDLYPSGNGIAGGNFVFNFNVGNALAGAYLFYKGSAFATTSDAAIAPNKSPLFPGQTATFANYTSYSRGINGLMLDIAGLAGSLTASDFIFKVGNTSTPSTWAAAPAPLSVQTRFGQGVGGSTRIEIAWADNAIANQWLQVTVKGGAGMASGFATDTLFYFGNAIADSGDSAANARVNATDEIAARLGAAASAAIGNPLDYNRDGKVDGLDSSLARGNYTYFVNQLNLIQTPAQVFSQAAAALPDLILPPESSSETPVISSPLVALPMGPSHLATLASSSPLKLQLSPVVHSTTQLLQMRIPPIAPTQPLVLPSLTPLRLATRVTGGKHAPLMRLSRRLVPSVAPFMPHQELRIAP